MATTIQCPICERKCFRSFLDRGLVPVHQNLVLKSMASAIQATRGKLELVICEHCGFVFNRAFDPSKLEYGEDYDNTQNCSAFFDAYLNDLVKNLIEEQGVRDGTIVEVGCGKGDFLRKLVEYPGSGLEGIGFDPSYTGERTDLGGKLRFETQFYDEKASDIKADFIVCRHVIEHVPNPKKLLKTTREALTNSSEARVFFETPCVEWILKNKVVWDFFYEHCSLFSAGSLEHAFEQTGFEVKETRHIFGGQYLWIEAKCVEKTNQLLTEPQVQELLELANSFQQNEDLLTEEKQKRAQALARDGKIALWGAGAKGVTFANLIDRDRSLFDSIIDLNPKKQGYFVSGTGHPIIAPTDIAERGITAAIVMNPNYLEENESLLEENNIDIQLFDWH